MSDYYFLASLFSELTIGSPPELSYRELSKFLEGNLKQYDKGQITALRRLYDLYNVRSLWGGDDLSDYGNYDENGLEEALLTQSGLPEYVYSFLDRYDETPDRLRHFPWLLATYFNKEIPLSQGFLRRYLTFEREWRLVATAFRAKMMGRDVGVELQHEDPYDELVAQILAQKDAPSFEAPSRFDGLISLLESKLEKPMALHQALCEYRFSHLRKLVEDDFFSMDKILGYIARLVIVEEWLELDKNKGLKLVETIVKEAS